MFAGARSGWDESTTAGSVGEFDLGLDGGIAARVENFTTPNDDDVGGGFGHGDKLIPGEVALHGEAAIVHQRAQRDFGIDVAASALGDHGQQVFGHVDHSREIDR